jgi:hypothetical protein
MFTGRQLATLGALVDRIIPPDDFPSGWEAGVGAYLERQLSRDLQPWIETYRAGLDARVTVDYIADGSIHVTNGRFNPVLTILALAFRAAEHIVGAW